MSPSTNNSKSNRDIIKDNLVMAGCYSAFGFLGLFLFYVTSLIPSCDMQICKVGDYMHWFVLGVSGFMFWFSTRVYKNGVKHDRYMQSMFDDIDKNLERIR